MKKYNSIGELLIDYRRINCLSQAEFAANVNVDIRTVRRWEMNTSRVASEKEEEIVMETLLPYQLVVNLNASVVIPTYYDFELRKYSLTSIAKELPKSTWFKDQINVTTNRIRSIDFEFDIDYIMQFLELKQNKSHLINREVIREAIKLLPEVNFIITDDSGFYAGHCLYFPIKGETYSKLKSREISKEELTINDLCNYRTQDPSIFFVFDSNADCNDNFYYLVSRTLTFLMNLSNKDYIYSLIESRHDFIESLGSAGIKIVWEGNGEFPLRFYEGNFNEFMLS